MRRTRSVVLIAMAAAPSSVRLAARYTPEAQETAMTDPTPDDRNPVDITPADAAEINAISHPLLADPASDDDVRLVQIDSSPDGVVTVTINRPDKRNAFDAATIAALREAFETLHGADNVRLVLVRGAGGTFSAGADLAWMRDAADWSESDNRD